MSYKFSQTAKKEYAEKMNTLADYCKKNAIEHSLSFDSFYFTINNKNYRISNHTVESRVEWGTNPNGELELQPKADSIKNDDTIYITASKMRVMEIHQSLLQNKILDKRGNIKE